MLSPSHDRATAYRGEVLPATRWFCSLRRCVRHGDRNGGWRRRDVAHLGPGGGVASSQGRRCLDSTVRNDDRGGFLSLCAR